ncbi:unnamed protein product [Ectocarpus sp. 8 AP-2014]
MSRVNSVSSRPRILLLLAISIGVATAPLPFWGEIYVFGTEFFLEIKSERAFTFVAISGSIVEVSVGICMLLVVSWLLLFRTKEVKQCWATHARTRYYFGLTLLAIVINIALGAIEIPGADHIDLSLNHMVWHWSISTVRFVHVALDTIVLYGVLVERFLAGGVGDISRSSPPSSALRTPTTF